VSETKRVVLRVPATLPADGVHCGDCDMVWPHARWYCSAWGESPLEEDEGGLLRCPECLAAEEREQPEPPTPICDACGPEGCRCEEDRR
jgi:hypothetical protein